MSAPNLPPLPPLPNNNNDYFHLIYPNHPNNLCESLEEMFLNQALTDVTICCEGVLVKAHRVVLAASSDYFRTIFTEPIMTELGQYPFIFVKGMNTADLHSLLEYCYRGETSVAQRALRSLIDSAKTLGFHGLGDYDLSENSHLLPSDDEEVMLHIASRTRGNRKKQLEDGASLVPNITKTNIPASAVKSKKKQPKQEMKQPKQETEELEQQKPTTSGLKQLPTTISQVVSDSTTDSLENEDTSGSENDTEDETKADFLTTDSATPSTTPIVPKSGSILKNKHAVGGTVSAEAASRLTRSALRSMTGNGASTAESSSVVAAAASPSLDNTFGETSSRKSVTFSEEVKTKFIEALPKKEPSPTDTVTSPLVEAGLSTADGGSMSSVAPNDDQPTVGDAMDSPTQSMKRGRGRPSNKEKAQASAILAQSQEANISIDQDNQMVTITSKRATRTSIGGFTVPQFAVKPSGTSN